MFDTPYGTYTTIDYPTKHGEEAKEYLTKEFEKIGGVVREIYNPHDLGAYPSFEIDYPEEINEIVLMEDDLEVDDEKADELGKWINEANKIQERYNKKFEEWL